MPHWTQIELDRHNLKHGVCNLTESDFEKPKQNKYRNKKVHTDDGTFDSKKEYNRWLVLKDMQERKEIFSLYRQKPFEVEINGKHICIYKSDFDYWQNGQHIIEDVKGFKTQMYKLKKKLVEAIHGVSIQEI